MESEKVTLAQAAGQVGVHVNTIKTWRRSGHLKSAELIIEHGVEVWHVNLDEVIQFAHAKRKIRVDSNPESRVYPVVYPENNTANRAEAAQDTGTGRVLARPEAAMLELITQTQKPLLEMIERRDVTIQELSAKVGSLEERLKAYESAQAAHVPHSNPEAAPSADITTALITPAPTPIPAKQSSGWFDKLVDFLKGN